MMRNLSDIEPSSLSQKHPLYQYYQKTWDLCSDAYHGGWDMVDPAKGYLARHQREHARDYQMRLERAYYINYTAPIVHIHTSHLFKQEIDRVTSDPMLHWWTNTDVDRRGRSFDTWMRERGVPLSKVFGHVHILVDMPRVSEEMPAPLTLQQNYDQSFFPYLRIITPLNLVNWEVDEHGDWEACVIEVPERHTLVGENAGGTPGNNEYVVWTKMEWARFDANGARIDYGMHNLGVVPIVTLYNVEHLEHEDDRIGVSAISDIAFTNKELFNLCSYMGEFIGKQCFNTLAVPVQRRSRSEKQASYAAIGSNNLYPYDPEAGKPSYITPPTDPARFILEDVNFLIEQIFRMAQIPRSTAGIIPEAGVSQVMHFHDTEQQLRRQAKNAADAEKQIAAIWLQWMNRKPTEVEVGGVMMPSSVPAMSFKDMIRSSDYAALYPDDFSLEDTTEEINQALAILSAQEFAGMPFITGRLKMSMIQNMRWFKNQPPQIKKIIESMLEMRIDDLYEQLGIQSEEQEGEGQEESTEAEGEQGEVA